MNYEEKTEKYEVAFDLLQVNCELELLRNSLTDNSFEIVTIFFVFDSTDVFSRDNPPTQWNSCNCGKCEAMTAEEGKKFADEMRAYALRHLVSSKIKEQQENRAKKE